MANEKQETINSLWIKYKNNLEMLDGALDKINDLENTISELKTEVDNLQGIVEQKPKEVEKIVEVEAKIDLSTPAAVAELEAKLAKKLAKDDG